MDRCLAEYNIIVFSNSKLLKEYIFLFLWLTLEQKDYFQNCSKLITKKIPIIDHCYGLMENAMDLPSLIVQLTVIYILQNLSFKDTSTNLFHKKKMKCVCKTDSTLIIYLINLL